DLPRLVLLDRRRLVCREQECAESLVVAAIAQQELDRIHAQRRGQFVDEAFAGETACRLSRRAQIAGPQRDRARRLPGQVLSGDLLVRELIHLAGRGSSVGEAWVRRLEAHLPGGKQDAPGVGPWEAAVQVIPG